ncbi:MAG TPA: GNAT family N-acetyltransferase [Ktedonobacterales bacterium]|jgi:GNAT superfamily N-acetyltransferase
MRELNENEQSDILTDMTPDTLIHAIEENAAAFLLALGRTGGGDERDDSEITWTIGGSPLSYHNAVVRANLAPQTADALILASRERMAAYGVPGSWHVSPSMRHDDLGQRLIAAGFTYSGNEPGMAVDLHALNEDASMPESLTIQRVRSAADIAIWAATLNANGFGEGAIESEWVGAMYERLGCGDETPWRHYLGLLDSEPVTTSTLFLGAGVAGIYFVSVHPDARRRGIGAALTLAPLRAARELGYRVGVLGASALGEPVYRRLGFTAYCQIALYEWSLPIDATSPDSYTYENWRKTSI